MAFVENEDYAVGEMISSLQAGLGALPETTAGALVVLGVQPTLDGRVIRDVLAAYAEGRGAIVAPVYRGERGHPVLFDRAFLAGATGAGAGRSARCDPPLPRRPGAGRGQQ